MYYFTFLLLFYETVVFTLKLLRGTFMLVDYGGPCGQRQYEHHSLNLMHQMVC